MAETDKGPVDPREGLTSNIEVHATQEVTEVATLWGLGVLTAILPPGFREDAVAQTFGIMDESGYIDLSRVSPELVGLAQAFVRYGRFVGAKRSAVVQTQTEIPIEIRHSQAAQVGSSEQRGVKASPEELVDIRRNLIEAAIERQELALYIDENESLVDLRLANLINLKIGARLRDDLPLTDFVFPGINSYCGLPEDTLKALGLERAGEVDITLRTPFTYAINILKRFNGIFTIGDLRNSPPSILESLRKISKEKF